MIVILLTLILPFTLILVAIRIANHIGAQPRNIITGAAVFSALLFGGFSIKETVELGVHFEVEGWRMGMALGGFTFGSAVTSVAMISASKALSAKLAKKRRHREN